MEDESASLDGKGLLNMRVVDLKLELEKRGLSKSGSKKDLVKRLKQQLEFEKLCEERKAGDFHVELELDAKIQQNEFVQQYLAQQQKRYAEREEEKKLELKTVQKCPEESSTVSSEHQSEVDEYASSDTDDKGDEKQNMIKKTSENEPQSENTDDACVSSEKSFSSDNKDLHVPECDSNPKRIEENPFSPNSVASVCDTDVKSTCESTQLNKTNDGQTVIQNLSNVTKIEGTNLPMSKCLSETETKSLLVTEHDNDCLSKVVNIDDTKDLKSVEVNISYQSFDEKDSKAAVRTGSELTEHGKCLNKSSFTSKEIGNITSYGVSTERNSSKNLPKQKSSENMEVPDCSPVPYSLSDIQLPESPGSHMKSKDTKCEENDKIDHTSDEEINENSHSGKKNKSNGEAMQKLSSSQEDASESETRDSSYSNDSPHKIKMIKDKRRSDDSSDDESDRNSSPYKKKSFKNEDNSSNLAADSDNDHPKHTVSKEKNFVKAQQNTDESDIEKSSDSEKYNRRIDSKNKLRDKRRKRDSRSPSSSSSTSSSRSRSKSRSRSRSSNSSAERRRLKKSVTTKSKNFAQDDDSNQMSDKSSDKKSVKHKKNKNFSHDDSNQMSDKSSDEKLVKHKKNKNFSQDDDSNQMSDKSSDEKSMKHKKKTNVAQDDDSNQMSDKSLNEKSVKHKKKKKNAQDDDSNQKSDKSSDEKLVKHKKNDNTTESPADTSVSVKKRFKIKRDNIPIEIPKKKSPVKESLDANTSSRSIEKKSSYSASDKPVKQESIEEKEKPEINYKPRKIVLSNRKLNRKSSEDNNSIEPRSKKTKWESFASGQKSSHAYSISTDSLRNWFPDFKLVSETSMEVEQDEHSLSAIDEKNCDVVPGEALNENEPSVKQESTSQVDLEDTVSEEPNFDDTADLGPVSKIIFIQNLVRPFTLNQLKDLLKQNGRIVEEYFWIDKIKSKCFVMYESEKEAVKARNALNNTRWPSSNPKILSVEFSDVEELEKHQKGNEPPPLKPPEPPAIESSDTLETRVSHTVEEHKRKDRERRKEKERTKLQVPVREWDKDKIVQDSPERERPPKEEKPRSAEKKEKKESKKRATEDTPAKLLDDLFQKTKSVPCIYWLPLTEEQAKTKEEEKKMRRLEREKRNQQLREQEEAERRNRRARSSSRRREKENRKSSTRSRSPVSRRR